MRLAARPRRGAASTSQGHPRTIFKRALERGNLLVAEATAREIARWLCLWLEEHERATLEAVELLLSNLRSLATPEDHASALAIPAHHSALQMRTR
jgi:hypothetical protein